MDYFRISGEFIFLDIKVVPGVSKSAIGEYREGRLKIRIAAAPEDGKANGELCSFISKLFGLAKKDVQLVSGEKSRLKTLRLPLASKEKIEKLLLLNTDGDNQVK